MKDEEGEGGRVGGPGSRVEASIGVTAPSEKTQDEDNDTATTTDTGTGIGTTATTTATNQDTGGRSGYIR